MSNQIIGDDGDTISYNERQLAILPAYNRERLLFSCSLRNLLTRQFEETRSQGRLDQAIEAAEAAVSVATTLQLHIAQAWFALGMLLMERCEKKGNSDVEDLNYGIRCLDNAGEGLPDLYDQAMCLNNLSGLLGYRYLRTSNVPDIQRAVSIAERVLDSLGPDQNPNRALHLYNLGNKLRTLFEATKHEQNLGQAISAVDEAVALLPRNSPKLILYETECAGLLLRKFEVTDDIECLNRGIEKLENLSAIAEEWSLNQGEYWNILAGLLRLRYDRTEVKEDIYRAVNAARKAVTALPDWYPGYTDRLTNLAHMLWRKYRRDKQKEDIDSAITFAEQAVQQSIDGSASKATKLTTLAGLLMDRHTLTKKEEDINRAVYLAKQAVNATSPERVDYLINRSNLARILFLRATTLPSGSSLDDVDRAVQIINSVVADTPIEDARRALRLNNLGNMLVTKYEMTNSTEDLNEAVDALRQCSACSSAAPSLRIATARRAADLLISQSRIVEADVLLKGAVKLLRKVSPRSLKQEDQQHMIRKFSGLVTLATSIALEVGTEAASALEMLEEGRGIILGLLFEFRADTAELASKHPALAAKFMRLRDKLDSPGSQAGSELLFFETSVKLAGQERVAKEFDDVVDIIRGLEGFHNFLLPPLAAELQSAASAGPLVVINVSSQRSDAFIIQRNHIDLVPLPDLELPAIRRWATLLKLRQISQSEMFELLEWLWDVLAHPVLDRFLSGTTLLSAENPHVWWIPTGPLCSLPIHAAGKYRDDKLLDESLSERVISSYSPSVKALMFTQRNKRQWNRNEGFERPVLVSMKTTEECESLPSAEIEVEVVRDVLAESMPQVIPTVLKEPTKYKLMIHLKSATLLLFAGHGDSDPIDPLNSALLVQDWKTDRLTVKDLIALKLYQKPPLLAYLSACSTGRSEVDDLFDEGLHLMSAYQLVGFQHVIGSLWEVSDEDCVDVARSVITTMANSTAIDSSISLGLQEGVRCLRGQTRLGDGRAREAYLATNGGVGSSHRGWLGSADPRVWAAYIHIGL